MAQPNATNESDGIQEDELASLQEGGRAPSPPYISFLTFNNFVTWLEGEGIPLRFDRSFWHKKYSGSTGAQLMTALRFLGLLKGENPQPDLDKLVEAKGDERRILLAEILRKAYTTINFDALPRATPNMLTEWFRAYGLQGDTTRKAESFFINVCKAVDVPISNALRKKARMKPARSTTGVGRGRRSKKKEPPIPPEQQTMTAGAGISTSDGTQVSKVTLASGGEVTLAINVDLFQLSNEDREFVLKLVDTMKGYNKKVNG